LQRAGYDALGREDALGTAAAVAQETPDIVLLDVTMPGISGEALARLLNQGAKRQPVSIIFHSNREQAELERLAEQCKVLGAIQKTSSTPMFLLQFERLLRARTQLATARAEKR
jgi:DNA-binding response OmpR family regulator